MVTVVGLARRKAELNQEQFLHRWLRVHAVGTDYPGLVRYQIGVTSASGPYDGIALMTFTDMAAFVAASESEEGLVRRRDADSFCSSLEFMVVELHDVPQPKLR